MFAFNEIQSLFISPRSLVTQDAAVAWLNVIKLIALLVSCLASIIFLSCRRRPCVKISNSSSNSSNEDNNGNPSSIIIHSRIFESNDQDSMRSLDSCQASSSTETTWKEPCQQDYSFIPLLSSTFLLWEIQKRKSKGEEARYVLGKGSAGVGLYSLETKDAFRILNTRIKKEEVTLMRQKKHSVAKQSLAYASKDNVDKMVNLIRMNAYVKSRKKAAGPNLPLDPVKLYDRLSRLARKHNLSLENVVNGTSQYSFSLGHPEFPESISGVQYYSAQHWYPRPVVRVFGMHKTLNSQRGSGSSDDAFVFGKANRWTMIKLIAEAVCQRTLAIILDYTGWVVLSIQTLFGGYTLSVYETKKQKR